MAVLRTKFRTHWGKGGSKATALIGEHRREAKRKGGSCLAQEGDGTLFGLILFHGSRHRARASVDGDIKVALAPFARAGL
jgi:hypothetical protein